MNQHCVFFFDRSSLMAFKFKLKRERERGEDNGHVSNSMSKKKKVYLMMLNYFSSGGFRQKRFFAHQIVPSAAAKKPMPATIPMEMARFLRYAGTSKV